MSVAVSRSFSDRVTEFIQQTDGWFVVTALRLFLGQSDVAVSHAEGYIAAREFLTSFCTTSEDRAKLMWDALRRKRIQASLGAHQWKQQYPQASDAAAELMLKYGTDFYDGALDHVCHHARLWVGSDTGGAATEKLLVQVWLPSDGDDAMPLFVYEVDVEKDSANAKGIVALLLMNESRIGEAQRAFDQLIPLGYIRLGKHTVQRSDFEVDVIHRMLSRREAQTVKAMSIDFGTGVYGGAGRAGTDVSR
jgi:hypothetical protein